jgi:predicted permease
VRRARALLARLGGFFGRRDWERDLAEEIEANLQLHVDDNLRAGMTPAEARRAAMLKLGGLETAKEEYRDRKTLPLVAHLAQDARFALRAFRRQPGFAAVAVVTLALGIGANTAIFSVLDAVLWKSLPVRAPEELVFLERYTGGDIATLPGGRFRKFAGINYGLMEAFRERGDVLAGATTFRPGRMVAAAGGEAEPVFGISVDDHFFSVLGVEPFAGRLIHPGDAREGGIAVLSHRYWMRRFGGGEAVGRTLVLNGASYTIAGITPPEFFGLMPGDPFDVAVPLPPGEARAPGPISDPLTGRLFWVLARLKPGVTTAQADAALTAFLRRTMTEEGLRLRGNDAIDKHRIRSAPAARGLDLLRARFSKPLIAVMALVALVLLITCSNVANLLLARAAARQREMAIRVSIGAGRGRIARQLLTESVMLALGGGALGLAIAKASKDALLYLNGAGGQPMALDAALDLRALAFTVAVSLGTGLLFGLAPAFSAARPGVGSLFGRATHRLRPASLLSRALVVAQVALSVVLLVGAGLLVRSFQNLTTLDAGYRRDHVLLVSVNPLLARLKESECRDYYRRAWDRINALPGVVAASYSRLAPLSGGSTITAIAPPGYAPPSGQELLTWMESVGPRYFQALGPPQK